MNPAMALQPHMALCTIGDARQVHDEGEGHRRGVSVDDAEPIIDPHVACRAAPRCVARFDEPLRSYRAHAEAQRDRVLGKARAMLAHSHDPEHALAYLANTLTSTLLHTTSVRLHEAAAHADRDLLDAAMRLFDADGRHE